MSDKVLAFYIRLSMEDGDLKTNADKHESNSVGNQRKLLSDYYKSHEELQQYDVIEFCDDGYSGTNFNRPNFIRMMELVKLGQIHCIMVKDLSRFGREYLEVGAYLEMILPLFGTRFISANDSFDSNDYIGTTGGMELALRNLINGMYSKDLSVKVRSAIKTRNRRGQYWGGQPFYGYKLHPEDKHRLIVDENVRSTVALIYDLCIQGKSTMQIAKHLNELKILSPAQYKKQNGMFYNGRVVQKDKDMIWLGGTVRKILNDERYTGKMISGTRETVGVRSNKMRSLPRDQWAIVEDTHEAIITQEVFNLAKAALSARVKTVNKNTAGNRAYNLFVCGYCGRKLQKSNAKTTHLFCMQARSNHSPECESVHEPLALLQEKVLKIVQTYATVLLDQSELSRKQDQSTQAEIQREVNRLQQRIQAIAGSKGALYEEYRAGRYTADRFKKLQQKNLEETEHLQQRIELLEQALDTQERQRKARMKAEKEAGGVQLLSEYRPEVICKLVDQVKVYGDGNIEVELKCKDAYTPIELSAEAMTDKAG